MDLGMEPLETLLSGETGKPSAVARRWRNAAKLSLVGVGVLTVACAELWRQKSALQAQLNAQATQLHSQMLQAQEVARPEIAYAASRPSPDMRSQYTHHAMGSKGQILAAAAVDTCTAAGKDIFANNAGHALACCDGLVQASSPCRGEQICQFCVAAASPGDACTPAGTDVGDNNLHVALTCCPGLIKVDTPCRDGDTCEFCQPKGMGQTHCTPPGTDIFANPTGKKLPCCRGLTESTGPCRGDDVCKFCIPSTFEDGHRAVYPPAKVSVDPTTPKAAADKHKHKGMSLIFSDEFNDLQRTKAMFVFEDIPYGVPGNTGDVNIVSIYSSDTVSLIEGGGMRLSAYMAPEDEKVFMEGWNGTYNSNYKSDVSLWSWHAPKVTTRLNGRFQYGMIETRIKAPKGYGPWPAAWLNGCYGFVAESSGEFLVQDDYPFLCGQYWPPELDFFEHFSPEHTWFWRPNSMSLHSPNQYVGQGQKLTKQGGYCPTTLAAPGEAWCFGVSGAGGFVEDPTEEYHNYAMQWDPDGVDYYMNDVFMQRMTTEQMVLYLSGQLRPVMIPEMPMFLTYNIALVRKGMDLSHQAEGLTHPENFDPLTGAWKPMAMDIAWVRVYQDDTQGETRGLNPPITYETRRKLLANRVTCNLLPELRCMVKNGGPPDNQWALASTACDRLRALGDDYCDAIPKLCALNNAGNKEGLYGLGNTSVAQFANQRLSLNYGQCCIEEDKAGSAAALLDPTVVAADKPVCRSTPNTKLPKWLLESEYYEDPKLMYAKEGFATGLAGTNPAGWETYGLGLPRPPPPPPFMPGMAPIA